MPSKFPEPLKIAHADLEYVSDQERAIATEMLKKPAGCGARANLESRTSSSAPMPRIAAACQAQQGPRRTNESSWRQRASSTSLLWTSWRKRRTMRWTKKSDTLTVRSTGRTKIGTIMPQVDCFPFPDAPDVIVLNSSQFLTGTFSLVRVSSVSKVQGKRQWQTQNKQKTQRIKNPNASSSAHKLWVAWLPLQVHCWRELRIYDEGMNGVNEKLHYVTVYVRTISGETISTRCNRRQSITRIKDEIERKTKIPEALQHLSNQGKILSERKTIQENNMMNKATLEMTLRLQGGMRRRWNDDLRRISWRQKCV